MVAMGSFTTLLLSINLAELDTDADDAHCTGGTAVRWGYQRRCTWWRGRALATTPAPRLKRPLLCAVYEGGGASRPPIIHSSGDHSMAFEQPAAAPTGRLREIPSNLLAPVSRSIVRF